MKIKQSYINGSLLAIALCFSSIEAFCQKPEVTYYLNKSGYRFPNIKDADYLLLIMPPDPSADNNLYVVKEYYANGDLRFISGTRSLKLKDIDPKVPGYYKPILQGGYVSYFHNSHKMEIANYEDGNPVGDDILYYPNGKLYCTKTFVKDKPALYKECRDSTGNVLFENGNGKGLAFLDERFKNYLSGEVINGLPQGEWIGKLDDTTNTVGTYKNGELKTEAKLDKSGEKTYMLADTVAAFPGGPNAFSKFLARNMRYPAVAREANTQGRVIVSFTIDKEGRLGNFIIRRSVSKEIDAEAIRVLKMSPDWKPGMVDGQPVKIVYSIPLGFSLSTDN
jgi:TonB family protein